LPSANSRVITVPWKPSTPVSARAMPASPKDGSTVMAISRRRSSGSAKCKRCERRVRRALRFIVESPQEE
jgi:hypothetical protein